MHRHSRILLSVLMPGLVASCVPEQPPVAVPPPATTASQQVPIAAAMASSAEAKPSAPMFDLTVPQDIETRLAKFGPVTMDFDDSKLSAEDKTVLKKAVEATQIIQDLFMRQLDPQGAEVRAALAADPSKAAALKYFDIMAGRWDSLEHDAPFVGSQARPAGAGFYPADMTKEEFNSFLAKHPDQKDTFQSYFTVIVRDKGTLAAVPYSQVYRQPLEAAAGKLREAAAITREPTLKKFLELKAAALLSNDYLESDKAWMDVRGPIEITFGPYETYDDQLFQYKASFEAMISLRDQEESKRLEIIGQQISDIEKNLPMSEQHKKDSASRGRGSPIDVVHLLANGGKSGIQSVAYNLPNDERIRKEKGSKKVMLKNVLQGKFERIVQPIAAKLVAEDQLPMLNADAMFTYILMHEVAHGVGPGFITLKNGSKSEVSKELKELYGGIEEAKADITGIVNTLFLIDKKVYPKKFEKEVFVAYLATAFRQMRFGVKEAHGKGVVSSFNYLSSKGGIVYDPKTSRFHVDFPKFRKAVRELAHEYLTMEAEGNYEGAKVFFAKYAVLSPEMEKAMQTIGTSVPVDIAPHYTVYEKMKKW